MARDVRVRLKLKGINTVMSGKGARSVVNVVLYRMGSAAGPGHRVVPAEAVAHRWVARGYLEQEDLAQARKDPNGIQLLRALGSSGG